MTSLSRKEPARTEPPGCPCWRGIPKAEDLAICSPISATAGPTGSVPWSGEPDQIWRTTEFPASDAVKPGEIRLHQLDAPLEHCVELVRTILYGNVLAIDDVEVCYDLEPRPRSHWAYRNHMGTDDHSVNSPFSRHSAKVTEFWSFAPDPRDQWRRICESYVPHQLEGHLRGMGFRLDQRLDRVGNLMIAGALDDIDCELFNGNSSELMR